MATSRDAPDTENSNLACCNVLDDKTHGKRVLIEEIHKKPVIEPPLSSAKSVPLPSLIELANKAQMQQQTELLECGTSRIPIIQFIGSDTDDTFDESTCSIEVLFSDEEECVSDECGAPESVEDGEQKAEASGSNVSSPYTPSYRMIDLSETQKRELARTHQQAYNQGYEDAIENVQNRTADGRKLRVITEEELSSIFEEKNEIGNLLLNREKLWLHERERFLCEIKDLRQTCNSLLFKTANSKQSNCQTLVIPNGTYNKLWRATVTNDRALSASVELQHSNNQQKLTLFAKQNLIVQLQARVSELESIIAASDIQCGRAQQQQNHNVGESSDYLLSDTTLSDVLMHDHVDNLPHFNSDDVDENTLPFLKHFQIGVKH